MRRQCLEIVSPSVHRFIGDTVFRRWFSLARFRGQAPAGVRALCPDAASWAVVGFAFKEIVTQLVFISAATQDGEVEPKSSCQSPLWGESGRVDFGAVKVRFVQVSLGPRGVGAKEGRPTSGTLLTIL